MNINKYFDSPDIARYYIENDIQLNGLQTAFVIWTNEKITIEEKHSLYKTIIQTMPDMDVADCRKKKLHSLLRSYIDIENMLLNAFFENADKECYHRFLDSGPNDVSLKTVTENFREESYSENVKKDISMPESNRCLSMSVKLNREGKVIKILNVDRKMLTPNQKDIYTYFCNADIRIPMPFKKGDLITMSYMDPIIHPEATMVYLDMYSEDNEYWDDYADFDDYEDYDDDDYYDEEDYEFRNKVYCSENRLLQVQGLSVNGRGELYKNSYWHSFDVVYRKKNLLSTDKFLVHIGNLISEKGLHENDILDLFDRQEKLKEQLKKLQ